MEPLTQQQWLNQFESLKRYILSLIFLEKGKWDKKETIEAFICRQYKRCNYLSGATLKMHRSMLEPALQIFNAKTLGDIPFVLFTVNGSVIPLEEGARVLFKCNVPTMACYRRTINDK